MQRGEVWWASIPEPTGRRPVLLLSRNRAIQVREYVTVALITRTIRHLPVEVSLETEDGMPKSCVVNLDDINTIPKKLLSQRLTTLSEDRMRLVERALKFALDLN